MFSAVSLAGCYTQPLIHRPTRSRYHKLTSSRANNQGFFNAVMKINNKTLEVCLHGVELLAGVWAKQA